MAISPAIAATGQAILRLLADSCPRSEFPSANFELYHVKNFGTPMNEGISLYLYRITVNGSRRNLPPRVGLDGRRFRPSLPLDLYYILTTWAETALRQQRLLGWAMRTLEDIPILPAGLLNDAGPEPEVFQPDETVGVVLDPLSIQDMYNLWSAMKVSPPLSVTYIARIVNIDSKIGLEDAAHVQTRCFSYEKAMAG